MDIFIKTCFVLVIIITIEISVINSINFQAYGVRAIWRHYENMKDLVDDIKNGEKNDDNMDWDKFRDSTIYKEADEDVIDCINLANKVGQKLGDYEVVRCFENANYLKDKYSGDEESQSQGNVSQQQQDENQNQSQSQGNVSQQQQDENQSQSQSQGNVSQQQQDENQNQSQGNVSQTQNSASSNNASDTCDSSYPDVCIATYSAKLSCLDIPYRNFKVLAPDPHGLDSDGDGIGCEG